MHFAAPNPIGIETKITTNDDKSTVHWITDNSIVPQNLIPRFELAVHNSQFAKRFGSLQMSFCIFLKNCESLKWNTSRIFRVIHWTIYIVSYFMPIK